MTLKMHEIYHHYEDYFDWTKMRMKFTNEEFTETPHCMFKSIYTTHNFKVNRKCASVVGDAGALV